MKDFNTKRTRRMMSVVLPCYVIILGLHAVSASPSLCVTGLRCVHGTCTSGVTCQCDEGWTGALCTDKEVTSSAETTPPVEAIKTRDVEVGGAPERSKECFPGLVCMNGYCDLSTGSLNCVCDEGWSGDLCEMQGTDAPPVLTPNEIIPRVQVGEQVPEPGYGPLASFSSRFCVAGFECRYGNCTCQNCTPTDSMGCICEPGWLGVLCQDPCPLFCGPHGFCATDPLALIKDYWCECDQGWQGKNCSVIRRDDEEDSTSALIMHATSVSGSLVVVLLVLFTVVPYLLWRRGNLAMLKLVFWFQSIEEDDGRIYDAFVSYASTEEDRQFVMECLIPVLEEQMAFTLCIHERDFMPGKYITSNILESVRQSRRTLLVISPAFVSRNWCQFEFQMAVAEMIEKKNRILPVMIGDVKQIKQAADTNDTFQRVINTVTYLQYPVEGATEQELQRFWKRLELSMPKRSTPASQSTPCSPVQTPTSITTISLEMPPIRQHSQKKCNQITFPTPPTPTTKTNTLDETNLAPLPSSHNSDNNTEEGNQDQTSSKKSSNNGGVFVWFKRKFGRRKKNSTRRSIYMQTHISHTTPKDETCNNGCPSMNSTGVGHNNCVELDDKSTGGDTTQAFKGKSGREVNPLKIDLSGWQWPTPDSVLR